MRHINRTVTQIAIGYLPSFFRASKVQQLLGQGRIFRNFCTAGLDLLTHSTNPQGRLKMLVPYLLVHTIFGTNILASSNWKVQVSTTVYVTSMLISTARTSANSSPPCWRPLPSNRINDHNASKLRALDLPTNPDFFHNNGYLARSSTMLHGSNKTTNYMLLCSYISLYLLPPA